MTMSSTTSGPSKPTLPIIDISPFLSSSSSTTPPTTSKEQTIATLATACREYGFFYLTGHGVSRETRHAILDAARTFFTTAPPTEKATIRRQDPGRGIGDGARGYQVLAENVTQGKRDWHEAVDWYREVRDGEGVEAADLEEVESPALGTAASSDDNSNNGSSLVLTLKSSSSSSSSSTSTNRSPPYPLLQGINLWPSRPPDFRSLYTSYITQIRHVGTAVLLAMGQALELSQPDLLAASCANSFWVMRAIGYPPLDPELAAAGGVSCGRHTDYGCLTLLLADETKGALQVLRNTGATGGEDEEWIPADPVPDAYVVNVGDMVELWTGGLVKSTVHRVVHTGANYRVSVPFFLEPGLDVVVEPLPECVARRRKEAGGDGERDYGKPIRYGDHLANKVGGNFYGGGGGEN